MYTLLWIPRTGLFYSGNHFRDGDRAIINWDKTIPVFKTSQRAEQAREKILAAYPSAKGELIVFNVTLREMP
jgi:hypothetical protein